MSDIDSDTRLAVIREICRKEGHGELIDWTSYEGPPGGDGHRYACSRGCGTSVYELTSAVTLEQLNEWLQRKGLSGTTRLRGTIEVER